MVQYLAMKQSNTVFFVAPNEPNLATYQYLLLKSSIQSNFWHKNCEIEKKVYIAIASKRLTLDLESSKLSLKRELQCKTTLWGVKEGHKLRFFSVVVFLFDPLFKSKKPFLLKSCTPYPQICRRKEQDYSQFQAEGNRILLSLTLFE